MQGQRNGTQVCEDRIGRRTVRKEVESPVQPGKRAEGAARKEHSKWTHSARIGDGKLWKGSQEHDAKGR